MYIHEYIHIHICMFDCLYHDGIYIYNGNESLYLRKRIYTDIYCTYMDIQNICIYVYLNMFIHIYTFLCMWVFMYIHICMHLDIFRYDTIQSYNECAYHTKKLTCRILHMHVWMCNSMCIYIYMYTYEHEYCIYVYMCTHAYMYMYIHLYIYIHMCMYVYIYTYIYTCI